jgi:hypothetical protein
MRGDACSRPRGTRAAGSARLVQCGRRAVNASVVDDGEAQGRSKRRVLVPGAEVSSASPSALHGGRRPRSGRTGGSGGAGGCTTTTWPPAPRAKMAALRGDDGTKRGRAGLAATAWPPAPRAKVAAGAGGAVATMTASANEIMGT